MTLSGASSQDFAQLAYDKLSAVIGPDKARVIQNQILSELGIELKTAQDLHRFSQSLTRLGGFEGAVGAMLGVTAIMRGARPTPDAHQQARKTF